MVYIGIDVGKETLDVAAAPTLPALPRRVANTAAGIADLVAGLRAAAPP